MTLENSCSVLSLFMERRFDGIALNEINVDLERIGICNV